MRPSPVPFLPFAIEDNAPGVSRPAALPDQADPAAPTRFPYCIFDNHAGDWRRDGSGYAQPFATKQHALDNIPQATMLAEYVHPSAAAPQSAVNDQPLLRNLQGNDLTNSPDGQNFQLLADRHPNPTRQPVNQTNAANGSGVKPPSHNRIGGKQATSSHPAGKQRKHVPRPETGLEIMKKAAKLAGVPESWAADPSLWKLLAQESSSTPYHLNNTMQNSRSSAYGIFQFLNGTWLGTGIKKTSDPLQQAIAGLRYIKHRYGSPQTAWNHELATRRATGVPWY